MLRPIVSVGVGTLYAAVDGNALPPNVGVHSSQWAIAFQGGAGIQARLSRHFDLAIEGQALFAEPYPLVRFLGVEVAHGGLPSILGSLTLLGWL